MRGTQCQVRQILFSSYFRRMYALYIHIYVMHCPYPYSHLPTCVQNPPILYSSQRMTLQLFYLGREDELGKMPKFDRCHCKALHSFASWLLRMSSILYSETNKSPCFFNVSSRPRTNTNSCTLTFKPLHLTNNRHTILKCQTKIAGSHSIQPRW